MHIYICIYTYIYRELWRDFKSPRQIFNFFDFLCPYAPLLQENCAYGLQLQVPSTEVRLWKSGKWHIWGGGGKKGILGGVPLGAIYHPNTHDHGDTNPCLLTGALGIPKLEGARKSANPSPTLCQPCANPSPTLRQPFTNPSPNSSANPSPSPSFCGPPGTRLETRANGFLEWWQMSLIFLWSEIQNYIAEADADLMPVPGQLELHCRCRYGVLLSPCFGALYLSQI